MAHPESMAPRPTHELKAKVFMEWQVAGFQVWRVFDSSWQLFKQLESIAHQGGQILTISEGNAEGWAFQLSAESLHALNLYLAGFGELSQWVRRHQAGPFTRWAWVDFKRHLCLRFDGKIVR